MSIDLPEKPKDFFFEHLILAAYHCIGHYVEHSIQRRVEGTDILEIDGFTTDFSGRVPESTLVECKSSKHGFGDLFKLVGWMKYLNLSKGALAGPLGERDASAEVLRQTGQQLGVDIIVCDAADSATSQFVTIYAAPSTQISIKDLDVWRFAYWVEANLLKDLKSKQKSAPEPIQRFGVLQKYYERINSSIFFTRNLVDRIDQLYDNYKENPNLVGKCGSEILTGDFGNESADTTEIFRSQFVKCEYGDLQIAAFLEHRARMTLMKNGIEFNLLRDEGVSDDRTDTEIEFLGSNFDRYDLLPDSFTSGMARVKEGPNYRRYPVLWQWYFFVFGGFILEDKKREEYQFLSQKSGIPEGEIELGLRCYEEIFPATWFRLNGYSNIRHLKMMPPVIMGLGSFNRLQLYTTTMKYEDIPGINQYAKNHMIDWHNATYYFLGGRSDAG
jgi:hypothetical protein